MPDISKIKLPGTNTIYDIKDAVARSAISGFNNWTYVVCSNAANTPKDVKWNSGGTTITGTLVASSSTMYKIYLVPSTNGTKDIYDEYITVNPSENTYVWEMFGNTDVKMDDLGDFATVDTGTVSITPHGSNSSSTVSFGNHTKATVLTSDTTAKVPAVTGTTKYLTASGSGTEIGVATSSTALTGLGTPTSKQFVTSYPGTSSKLVTTTVLGLSTSTVTASFASAGTSISVAKVGTQVSLATGALGASTASQGADTVMWSAVVDENETLSFTFKPLSKTGVKPAADGGSITPYTFTNITVPVANETATTVATGGLSTTGGGASVLTGLGTASKDYAVTGYPNLTSDTFAQTVAVTAQPTVTLTGSTASTTGAIKYTETISTSTAATVSVTFTQSTAQAITALGTATAAAQTWTGSTESFIVYPSST